MIKEIQILSEGIWESIKYDLNSSCQNNMSVEIERNKTLLQKVHIKKPFFI